VKAQARTFDRDIEVYTVGHVICRPTQLEADEYYQHAIIENADWGAVERMIGPAAISSGIPSRRRIRGQAPTIFAANAIGGYPFNRQRLIRSPTSLPI